MTTSNLLRPLCATEIPNVCVLRVGIWLQKNGLLQYSRVATGHFHVAKLISNILAELLAKSKYTNRKPKYFFLSFNVLFIRCC